MILPKFEYIKAKSVGEAVRLFANYGGQAQYLAGGTDLIPQVKLRLHAPPAIIDLKNIKELSGITKRDSWLVIGANTTLFELRNNSYIREYFPALYESLDATSCETLQMRGTIGGNILQNTRCLLYNKSLEWRTAKGFCFKMGGETCNVVPNAKACFSNYCSDNAPSLITLSAEVNLYGPQGERRLKLQKIFSGDGRSPFTLLPGEILTEICIPLKKTKGAYEKLRVRDSMDYPLVGVAISLRGKGAKVSVCAIGSTPFVYDLKNLDKATIEDVFDRAYKDAKPVLNATLSPLYRKRMAGVLTKRVIKKVLQGGK